MKKRKICPLVSGEYENYDCEFENCEWWNQNECAIKTMAKCMAIIAADLIEFNKFLKELEEGGKL